MSSICLPVHRGHGWLWRVWLAVSTLVFSLLAGLLAAVPASAAPNRPPTNTPFSLVNLSSGRCADLPFFGPGRWDDPVTQYDCRYTGDNQRWQLERHGVSGGRRAYLIKNVLGGCMDLPYYGKVGKATPISLYACRPKDDNQLFVAFPTAQPGVFKLAHALDHNLCLDVAGFNSDGNDARLTLWPCSNNDDHLWRLRTTSGPASQPAQTRTSGPRVDINGTLAPPADAQPKTYPVAVNEHGLRVREKPSTSARVVGGLFPGDRVRIICTMVGTTVRGRLGSGNIWNKIGDNKWVSDQYVMTGSDKPVAPSCALSDADRARAEEQRRDLALMEEMRRKVAEDAVPCLGHRHQGVPRANAPRVLVRKSYTEWDEISKNPNIPDKVEDEIIEKLKKYSKTFAKAVKRGLLIDSIEQRTRTEGWRQEWCEDGGMVAMPYMTTTPEFRVKFFGAPIEIKDDPLSIPFPFEFDGPAREESQSVQPLTALMDREASGCMPDSLTCLPPGINTAPTHPGAQPPPNQPR